MQQSVIESINNNLPLKIDVYVTVNTNKTQTDVSFCFISTGDLSKVSIFVETATGRYKCEYSKYRIDLSPYIDTIVRLSENKFDVNLSNMIQMDDFKFRCSSVELAYSQRTDMISLYDVETELKYCKSIGDEQDSKKFHKWIYANCIDCNIDADKDYTLKYMTELLEDNLGIGY